VRRAHGKPIGTGEAYDAYSAFCDRAGLRTLTGRAFADLLAELDMHALIRSRVLSKGRYGRTREIMIDASDDVVDKLYAAVRMNFDLGR
jgi:cell division control protein 6